MAHAIQKADPLSRSPILFNVGLGATATFAWLGLHDGQAHLTVVEKFGAALRFGTRNSWEAGIFVGGFLDPIIRRLAGDEVDPRWLVGGTLGVRQFSRYLPLGLELHVALAIPFRFNTDPRPAAGLVVLVPIDLVFQ